MTVGRRRRRFAAGAALAILAALFPLAAPADVSPEEMSGGDGDWEILQQMDERPPPPPPIQFEFYEVAIPDEPPLDPERQLVRDRCAACHETSLYDTAHHTPLRWTVTVLRMQVFYGARFNPGERERIVAVLLADRPPTVAAHAADAAYGLGGIGVPLLLWYAWRRFRRRPSGG